MTATTATTLELDAPRAPGTEPRARLGRWEGPQLDPKRNSLNLVRLVLALGVLVHHTFTLGGFEGHVDIAGINLGTWAVYGFFGLSGYLITASRMNRPLGTYLVQRIARIFPAFWACLLVTVLVFVPIAYWHTHGTLNGYLTGGPVTPIDYVLRNLTLRIGSYEVGTTLADVPYPHAWNGSLWTLYYEFACYLIIALLFCFGWWRRSLWPTGALLGVVVLLFSQWDRVSPYVGANADLLSLLQLMPFFLAGSLVYRLRNHLPVTVTGAAMSAFAVWVLLEASTAWGLQAAAPFLVYLLLWLGRRVPSPSWVRRNDLSYGTYIYAFLVQQLLAALGLSALGILPYTGLTVVVTAMLASASWFLVERPVMRRLRGPR